MLHLFFDLLYLSLLIDDGANFRNVKSCKRMVSAFVHDEERLFWFFILHPLIAIILIIALGLWNSFKVGLSWWLHLFRFRNCLIRRGYQWKHGIFFYVEFWFVVINLQGLFWPSRDPLSLLSQLRKDVVDLCKWAFLDLCADLMRVVSFHMFQVIFVILITYLAVSMITVRNRLWDIAIMDTLHI